MSQIELYSYLPQVHFINITSIREYYNFLNIILLTTIFKVFLNILR